MQTKKRVTTLFLLMLIAAVATWSMSHGQNEHSSSSKEQQSTDNPYPVVDFLSGNSVQREKDSKRRAKGKRYDNWAVQKEGWKDGIVNHINDWEVGLPALPAGESDIIITGTVLDAQAYLSSDNTGVYSEFNVKVDEVLKDATSSVSSGSSIAVERQGGRVRYPSGDIVTYLISGQGAPRVNKRYVLFLKREEENLSILTGYELQGGKAHPLDHFEKFKKFKDTSENSLINQIRSVIVSNTSIPPNSSEMGR